MANTTKTKVAPTQQELDARLKRANSITETILSLGYNASTVTSKYGASLTLIDFGNGNFLRAIGLVEPKKLPVINLLTGDGSVKGKIWQTIVRHDKATYGFALDGLLTGYAMELASVTDNNNTAIPSELNAVAAPANVTVQATVS